MSMEMSVTVSVHQPKVSGARVQPSGVVTAKLAAEAVSVDLFLHNGSAAQFVTDVVAAIDTSQPGFRAEVIAMLGGTAL